MATKRRKIEVHRLTISGLPEGTPYGRFLRSLRGARPAAEMVMKSGDKSHVLNEVEIRNRRSRLRFFSFTKGHRPDVLDTVQFSLQPNPLRPSQTGVEWTHVLGGRKGEHYLLVIERNFYGIWPFAIEKYLQWAIDSFYEPDDSQDDDAEPVTVSLDAEPGEEFLVRIDELDRVTEASVRVARPNPGWRDLQNELGDQARESDAKKAQVSMTARRNASLRKDRGIIAWIRRAFERDELDYAAVSGKRGGQSESFDTEKLGKRIVVEIEVDERGQVRSDDAWAKLSGMMDDLD
jgi:hypothetical protein